MKDASNEESKMEVDYIIEQDENTGTVFVYGKVLDDYIPPKSTDAEKAYEQKGGSGIYEDLANYSDDEAAPTGPNFGY